MEQGLAIPQNKQLLFETYGIVPAGNGTATVKVKNDTYLLCEEKNLRSGATDLVLKKPAELMQMLDKLMASPEMRDSPVLLPQQEHQRAFREAVTRGEAATKGTPSYDMAKPEDVPKIVQDAVDKFLKGGDELVAPGAAPAQRFGR